MPARNKYRKKRTINSVLLIITFLVASAVITGTVLLVLMVLGDDNTAISSTGESSISSEPDSSDSSSADTESEPEESSRDEVSRSYEDYIGVEYAIDISEWEQHIDPEDNSEYLILVGPNNPLPSDYVPDNMIDVTYTRKDGRATQKMVYAAEKALQAFLLEGAEYGVLDVTVTSAYRSYAYQGQIFNGNVDKNLHNFSTREECEEYVATFSARPGTSEHQAGLACDMHNLGSAQQSFGRTEEAKWLAQNAHRFGFILRYPEDKTEITGIIYEPWHFRFVGRKAATEMYENDLCLEEYLASLN